MKSAQQPPLEKNNLFDFGVVLACNISNLVMLNFDISPSTLRLA
jgi:hypothetical protein